MLNEGHEGELPLSSTASRGAVLLSGSSLYIGFAAALAQVVLGTLLTSNDYGVYAIAITFAVAFDVVREGGIGRHLSRLTASEYNAFWSSALYFVLVATVVMWVGLTISASSLASLFDTPELAPVLTVIAFALPLNGVAVVAFPRLQIDFRFGTLASIRMVSATMQYALVVVLALRGFGALSFVWPLAAVGVFESVVGWYVARLDFASLKRRSFGIWGVLSTTGWSLVGTALHRIEPYMIFLALGFTVDTVTVGLLFFAFQLTFRLLFLFTGSVQRVVLPTFVLISEDAASYAKSIARAGRAISLVAGPVFGAVIVWAAPVTAAIWGDRWTEAVLPIQLFAGVMAFYLLSFLLESSVQAAGRFDTWSRVLFGSVVALLVAVSVIGRSERFATTSEISVMLALALLGVTVGKIILLSSILDVRLVAMGRSALPIVGWIGTAAVTMMAVNGGDEVVVSSLLYVATSAVLAFVFKVSYVDLVERLRGTA